MTGWPFTISCRLVQSEANLVFGNRNGSLAKLASHVANYPKFLQMTFHKTRMLDLRFSNRKPSTAPKLMIYLHDAVSLNQSAQVTGQTAPTSITGALKN